MITHIVAACVGIAAVWTPVVSVKEGTPHVDQETELPSAPIKRERKQVTASGVTSASSLSIGSLSGDFQIIFWG